jgi:hypothetical protein
MCSTIHGWRLKIATVRRAISAMPSRQPFGQLIRWYDDFAHDPIADQRGAPLRSAAFASKQRAASAPRELSAVSTDRPSSVAPAPSRTTG